MHDVTLRGAVAEAIRESAHWLGGAVVMRDGESYYAYPGAYMNDISYTGSRDVVWRVSDPTEVGGPDATADDAAALADLVVVGDAER